MIRTILGNFVVSDQIPEGTIYLVPPVEHVVVTIESTGEIKEYLQWDAKQGGVIFNIGGSK